MESLMGDFALSYSKTQQQVRCTNKSHAQSFAFVLCPYASAGVLSFSGIAAKSRCSWLLFRFFDDAYVPKEGLVQSLKCCQALAFLRKANQSISTNSTKPSCLANRLRASLPSSKNPLQHTSKPLIDALWQTKCVLRCWHSRKTSSRRSSSTILPSLKRHSSQRFFCTRNALSFSCDGFTIPLFLKIRRIWPLLRFFDWVYALASL